MSITARNISVFKIAAMYAGAVIGAGFASGQEVMQFFTVYGIKGLWGVVVATMLLAYLGASILYLSVKYGTGNYLLLINNLTAPWVARIFDLLSIAMLLAGLSVMLSGSGAVFSEYLRIAAWPGVLFLLFIVGLVLTGGMARVIRFNSLLVPVKIAAIFIVSLLVIAMCKSGAPPVEGMHSSLFVSSGNWFVSGVLYVSYNMILVLAVLSTLGDRVTSRRAVAGGVVGGVVLGIAVGVLLLAQLKLYPAIAGYKVPVLFMAGEIGDMFRIPVAILIWLAILTTAVANAHGLAARFAPPGSVKYKLVGVGCTLMALPLARLDFDRLVGTIYPVFGYAGLLMVFILLVSPLLPFIKRIKV